MLMVLANVGWGQIAAWDFTGVGSTSLPTFTATTFNANLVSTSGANNITRGSGANWSTGTNSFRTTGFQNNGISTSNTDYFQITLTATTGNKISLSTIDARFAGTTSFCASPGVSNQFAYSLDGTNFTLIGSPQVIVGTPSTLAQISLAGISALQNIAAGTTVTIRYYASGQTTTGGWGFNSPSSGTNGLAIGGSVTPSGNLTPPTLNPDITSNNVDNNLDITFTDDASWRAAITSVKIGSTALTLTTDYVISAGNIQLIPSGLNALLTTPGNKSVTVVATGYNDASVTQVINTGAAYKLVMKTQPTAPTANGTTFAIQPAVYIQDRYGNSTTSTASVVANVGLGSWTIGGTTTMAAVNGTATFTDLTATSPSAVLGATINFTSTGLTSVSSSGFDIPAPISVLSVTPSTLTGFNYIAGNGPSASQSFTISGVYLDGSDVTISGSTNYEISEDNVSFTNSITFTLYGSTIPSTPIYVRLKSGLTAGNYNSELISSTGGGARQIDVTCNGVVNTPTISISTATLTGFTYEFGTGPSSSQSYNLSGSYLLPASGNLTITAPTDFEVSTSSSGTYSSSLTIAYTSNTLSSTPVYVRLKAGLPVATYSAEIIANTGGSATQQDVSCSGTVSSVISPITWTGTAGDGLWSSATNWSGGVVPTNTDRVLLDNSTVSGTYTVTLPSGAVKTTISRLTISPNTGNNITLTLPVTNTYGATNDAGLVVGDAVAGTDDIILNSGAILINASGGTSGNGIMVNLTGGLVRINNGGKFTHSCSRSTGGIVPFLSTVAGTELGEFEYDVAGNTNTTISASGRIYGTVSLTKTSGTGTYSSSGTSAFTIRGNFKINTGVSYSTTMTADMNIAGNIINNGSALTISTQLVNLNGTTTQNISGTGNVSFNNLTINNSTGITLSRDLTLTGTLTFTSGKLTLGTSNLMLPAVAVVGANSSNYIVTDGTGYVKRTISTGNLSFPVGTSTGYAPVYLQEATATNDYSVRVEPDVTGSSPESRIKLRWTITKITANTPNITMTLGWMGVHEGTVFANNRSTYAKFFDIATGLEMGTGTYTQQFSTEPYTNQRSGITTFSPIGVGPDIGTLPVALSSLNSAVAGRTIRLNWTTASEINNTGFDVERMNIVDNNWSKVTFVAGHGTVNTPTNYSFEDRNLQTGKYKYRLKQIDNNGNYEYFALNGEVEIGVPKKFDLSQNYPNPFNPVTKINFDLPENGLVNLRLYDMLGREVANIVNNEYRTAGYYTVNFDASKLSSGIYFYRMNAGSFSGIKKMAVIK